MDRYDRIYAGLACAAIGDAMGGATEIRSQDLIVERFGGFVEDFKDSPDDTFMRGMPKGMATDDFSLAYYTAKAIIEHGGVSDDAARQALLEWSETPYYAFAGPSTKRAVDVLKGIPAPENPMAYLVADNSRATNGSAMKISPVGFANAGNVKKAVEDSVTINRPTHNNNISLSAGAAIAAAAAEAAGDSATVESVVAAAVYGAKRGFEIGEKTAVRLAGPSVEKRIALAVRIASRHVNDIYAGARELSDIIGSGLMAAEAVPAAIGLFACAQGDALQCILGGVNIGNDTDTVATMAGALGGAFGGFGSVPREWAELVQTVNGFDLRKTAKELSEL